MSDFPEYACAYARRLAAASPRFALQVSAKGEEGEGLSSSSSPFTFHLSPFTRRGPGQTEFGPDPFGELGRASKCWGLKQRFPDRVLIMTADACFMNCRHCTRRGLLGRAQVVRTPAQLADCVAYVRAHPQVRDVLLSGGDVLTLPDAQVLRFVRAFADLPQVEVVRVCTRAVCANPRRVTRPLALAMRRVGRGKVWVNTQFNCADEVTAAARQAAARLVDAGIPVGCQTVLLRGVNDSTEEMLRLFRALSAARIRPYYVFTCDPVAGIDRFRVPVAEGRRIERECAERIGGLALPRFVADLPGAPRKTPLAELP